MQQISRQLAEDRAPAFYIEKEYTQQQAEEALQSANKVLEEAKKLTRRLNSAYTDAVHSSDAK